MLAFSDTFEFILSFSITGNTFQKREFVQLLNVFGYLLKIGSTTFVTAEPAVFKAFWHLSAYYNRTPCLLQCFQLFKMRHVIRLHSIIDPLCNYADISKGLQPCDNIVHFL